MRTIKQLLMTVVVLLCSATANAHDFEVGGIYYNIISTASLKVEVTYKGNLYSTYSNEYFGIVVIPETVTYNGNTYSVTRIAASAFKNCSNLKSVAIPNSVTRIGDDAFYNCSNLKSVAIGNSVTSIADYAFNGCRSLKTVINLSSLTISKGSTSKGYVGYYASKVINSPNGSIEGGLVFAEIDGDNTLCCYIGNATELSLPENYKGENYVIADSVFAGCSSLTSVTIPNSVTRIGDDAFRNCSGLTSVTIGNSVTSIGYYAFSDCNLTSLTIPNSVTSIGNYAFYDCNGLSSVTIPNSITSIGNDAFYRCDISKAIWLTNTPPTGYENVGAKINYVANDQYSDIGNVKIYPYLSSIFEVGSVMYVPVSPAERTCDVIDCLYDNAATDIVVDETVQFKGVAMSVKEIMPYAFSSNKKIKKVTVSNNGNIGNYAFSGCSSLGFATVSNNGNIGDNAFSNCSSLGTATVSNNGYIGDNAFSGCSKLVTATLGNSVKSIGASAFEGCSKLNEIVVPDAVKAIGSKAFYGCSSLQSVKVGDGVKDIKSYTFYGCNAMVSIALGSSITTIGDNAFYNCSTLPEIKIPNSVTKIENYAFDNCTSLADVVIEDRASSLSMGSNGSSPLFSDCPLDSVYIGGKIDYNMSSSYGYSPFYRNTSLRTVVITNKEETIYDNEFYGCSNLKNVSIGNGVTSIGKWAFSGCSNLDYFAFGKNVQSIGGEAFSDCTNLTMLISQAVTPPTCGTQALDDINKWNCTLYVPLESMVVYQSANQWKDFFFINEIPTGIDEVNADVPTFEITAGGILFTAAEGKAITIYSTNGALVEKIDCYDGEEIMLDRGVYIVRVGGKAVKVKL